LRERYNKDIDERRHKNREYYRERKERLATAHEQARAAEPKQPTRALSVKEIQAQSVKNWLAYKDKDQKESEQIQTPVREKGHGRDDDLTK
jgi:hypothetical protein